MSRLMTDDGRNVKIELEFWKQNSQLERPQSSSPPSHTNFDILALSETWLNLPETLEARHQKEENYALR